MIEVQIICVGYRVVSDHCAFSSKIHSSRFQMETI